MYACQALNGTPLFVRKDLLLYLSSHLKFQRSFTEILYSA